MVTRACVPKQNRRGVQVWRGLLRIGIGFLGRSLRVIRDVAKAINNFFGSKLRRVWTDVGKGRFASETESCGRWERFEDRSANTKRSKMGFGIGGGLGVSTGQDPTRNDPVVNRLTGRARDC